MLKTDALRLLGGTVTAAASAVGVSYQAVNQWPDVLPRRIEDRVFAAIARQRLPELTAQVSETAASASLLEGSHA